MDKAIKAYEAERAETLARLVLTRKKGVSFNTLVKRDAGLDFIVSMKDGKDEIIAAFGGIIVSTPDLLPDARVATHYTKGWQESKHLRTCFPLLLFLFSTADGWLLRPREGKLEWGPSLEMSKITKKSVNAIFETAESWNRTVTEALAAVPAE